MIYRGQYRNLGLKYEYTVPKKEVDYTPEYSWVFSDWSLCTVTCGGGVQTSRAFCHEVKSGIVEDQFCNDTAKPEPIARECNPKPCPARYIRIYTRLFLDLGVNLRPVNLPILILTTINSYIKGVGGKVNLVKKGTFLRFFFWQYR